MTILGDQMFRTEDGSLTPFVSYVSRCKYPYIYFADCKTGSAPSYGYINNSLEGDVFDSSDAAGTVIIPNGLFTPNFAFYNTGSATSYTISAAVITSGICTITCTGHAFEAGDLVAITGVPFRGTSNPFINGTWTVFQVVDANTFTFEVPRLANATLSGISASCKATKGSVFTIADDRAVTDPKGKSFTSVLFTPKEIYRVNPGFVRILPSDLYTRFKFQSYSDVTPTGGINSNLFNVLDDAGNNIQPVLWAYFFGYNDSSIIYRSATEFEIAFNSYAIVLRPSGTGSALEFALVKFNWGLIPPTTGWTNILGQPYFNTYTVSGTDLGYLIATNPETGKITTPTAFSPITEIAKSDPFTYSAAFAAKFNLKITIRKHLLTDSDLDGTYLVNLMTNDNYDSFGEGSHYDSILHGYITKPSPTSVTTTGSHPYDDMLMPMMYFKFNNVDEDNVGLTASPGSSKIVQDSLIFRQLNSVAATSYLY